MLYVYRELFYGSRASQIKVGGDLIYLKVLCSPEKHYKTHVDSECCWCGFFEQQEGDKDEKETRVRSSFFTL